MFTEKKQYLNCEECLDDSSRTWKILGRNYMVGSSLKGREE